MIYAISDIILWIAIIANVTALCMNIRWIRRLQQATSELETSIATNDELTTALRERITEQIPGNAIREFTSLDMGLTGSAPPVPVYLDTWVRDWNEGGVWDVSVGGPAVLGETEAMEPKQPKGNVTSFTKVDVDDL